MHEMAGELSSWEQIKAWRAARRKELIALRLSRDADARKQLDREMVERLASLIDVAGSPVLGIYFPIRGEIDLRELARRHVAAGGQVALPVVVEKGQPVEFWQWEPGARTRRGLWNIPIPRERIVVHPQTLIVPLVGFDRSCFRLGYGAGYYDRTLAAAVSRPRAIGIAHSDAELPHDPSAASRHPDGNDRDRELHPRVRTRPLRPPATLRSGRARHRWMAQARARANDE